MCDGGAASDCGEHGRVSLLLIAGSLLLLRWDDHSMAVVVVVVVVGGESHGGHGGTLVRHRRTREDALLRAVSTTVSVQPRRHDRPAASSGQECIQIERGRVTNDDGTSGRMRGILDDVIVTVVENDNFIHLQQVGN